MTIPLSHRMQSGKPVVRGPLVLAVSGMARHGKDTTADYLVKNYGFQKFSVADPLKDICRTIFQFDHEQLYGSDKEVVDQRWGISPRQALQFIGTELFRNNIGELLPEVGENIWIECLYRRLEQLFQENPNQLIVIADARFANEVRRLKDLQLPTVHSVRILNPRINMRSTHASENMNWDCDFNLENSGSFEELYHKIDQLLSTITE